MRSVLYPRCESLRRLIICAGSPSLSNSEDLYIFLGFDHHPRYWWLRKKTLLLDVLAGRESEPIHGIPTKSLLLTIFPTKGRFREQKRGFSIPCHVPGGISDSLQPFSQNKLQSYSRKTPVLVKNQATHIKKSTICLRPLQDWGSNLQKF